MLEINALRKSFGGKPALRGLSFSVGKGEIHGLLGHNGAGKSTTLGIILGMVMADSGEVTIDGIPVSTQRSQALRKVGAIFEAPAFYDYLSGWENLRILMGYSGGFDADAAQKTVDEVGLTQRIHSKVRTYSHGMRQRLALAQALLPEPELLLLDEPTDGLDPEGIKWFRDFILNLRDSRGMTVLFNSHLLAEVELMCDRVTILRQGELVFEGAIDGLREETDRFAADLDCWEKAMPVILSNGGKITAPGIIQIPQGSDPSILLAALVQAGIKLRSFSPVRRSLEDVYMELLEGKKM
ncbi:MAG: ABC transporter ATP-binding protein [Verrucomicrobia bacterium]|nr:ABC transporter ATP-binding protein [Verrucomicrobiota bacterium]